MANENVVNHFIKQYTDNVVLLSQQKGSKLRGAVSTEMHIGDGAVAVDQIAESNDQEAGGRNQPIVHQDLDQRRRWVYPQGREWSTTLSSFDKVKLLGQMEGKYTETGVAAMRRRIDRIIIPSFFATSVTGVAGAGTDAFPAGNQVSVSLGGTTSGLNVAKLLEAQRLLEANDVDTEVETVYCGITAKQHNNLLNEIQVVSKEFNSAPIIEGGRVKQWGIFRFIQSELFELDGSSYRRCPVWVPSGMHLGIWRDINVDISHRKDLSGQPWQVYMDLVMGATRLDSDKVMEIKCSEA